LLGGILKTYVCNTIILTKKGNNMLSCFKGQQTHKSQDVFVAKGVEPKPQPKADQKSLSDTPKQGAEVPKPDSIKKGCLDDPGCIGGTNSCLNMF
jgi:hypothetical protein